MPYTHIPELEGGAGGGAPTDATYVTQTAHADLSAEQALSSLSTGLMKVTTGTGAITTAVAGTDYLASIAIGTAITSATQGSVLFAGVSGALTQDNANLFWNDSTNCLSIGGTTSTAPLTIHSFENNGNHAAIRLTAATYEGIVKTNGELYIGTETFNQDVYILSGNGVRMRVTGFGNVVLGNAGTVIGATDTDGYVYLPTIAGTPGGTPTAYATKTAMCYDTTANKLWIYNGAWRSGSVFT